MSDANRGLPDETVSVDARLDRLCDRYEFLLLAGQPVTVHDFVRGEGIDPAAAAPDLLTELERLAEYYRPENRPTVDAPVAGPPDEEADTDIRAGAVLGGRYELLEPIGRGGMGEVWRARQIAPLTRAVAVKVIRRRPGQDSRAILARFEAERQTLALMDHPNIAKVLDAGTAAGGQPYFVMELIKGVPITDFCDARRLTPADRLRLFVPVCAAIQHAHQKGVIHRDIKPGNVLVALHDDRPVPVVIDFGIAKAFGQALTADLVGTGHWAVVGTPEYMSPEQATFNQLDIDTRSDVYSLGVLLYELLTGTTPVDRHSLADAALHEILRVVREVEAPRPSHRLSSSTTLADIATNRGTEPKRLGQQYRGELDWVLLKALEKDRGRRYESANAFAADIERHLADEVVTARPPTRGYRLRKFVARNRVPVVAAAAVFLALVGGVVGTTLGLLAAEQQRGEAETARGKEAERADGERKAKEEAEAKRQEADEQRRLADAERSKAVTAAQLEAAARKQEEAERRHAEVIAEFVREDFFALTSLDGQSRFAGLAADRLDPNLTLRAMLDRAAEKLSRRKDLPPRTEADLRWMIGVNYSGQGDYPNAVAQLTRCAALRQEAFGADDRETLSAWNSLALAHGNSGRPDLAVPLLERVVAGVEKRSGPNDADVLAAVGNLAVAYRKTDQPARAVPLLERVLKAETIQPGPGHPRTLVTMDNLAIAYRHVNRLDLAVPLHERAVAGLRVTPGPDHPDTLTAMMNLAGAYTEAGRPKESLPLLRDAHAAMADKLSPNHPKALTALANLAAAYWSDGQLDRSVPLFEDAVRRHRAVFGRTNPNTLAATANLGVNYRDSGRLDEALPLLEEAYRASPRNGSLRWVGNELIDAYVLAGRREAAVRLLGELLTDARQRLPKGSLQLAVQLAMSGFALLDLRGYAEAEVVLRESLEIRERLQPDGWSTFNTRSLLGGALLGQKKFAAAEPLLVSGYLGMKAREKGIPPQGVVRIPEAIDRLILLSTALRKPDEVAKWRAERAKYPHEVAPSPRPKR